MKMQEIMLTLMELGRRAGAIQVKGRDDGAGDVVVTFGIVLTDGRHRVPAEVRFRRDFTAERSTRAVIQVTVDFPSSVVGLDLVDANKFSLAVQKASVLAIEASCLIGGRSWPVEEMWTPGPGDE